MPALARLLNGTMLQELCLDQLDPDLAEPLAAESCLFDAPAAALLAESLRANRTLESLSITYAGMLRDADSAAATAVILGALLGHPSLQKLDLTKNVCSPDAAHIVGAALGALVAANAPALRELILFECQIPDEGLAPLFEALPANTHLRVLDVGGNRMSGALLRSRLLPALRANTSLEHLKAGHGKCIRMGSRCLAKLRRCRSNKKVAALLPWLAEWPDTAYACTQRSQAAEQ